MNNLHLYMRDKEKNRVGYVVLPMAQDVLQGLETLIEQGRYGAPFTRWVHSPNVQRHIKFYPGISCPYTAPRTQQIIEETAFLAERDVFTAYFLEETAVNVMVALTPNNYLLIEVTLEENTYISPPFRIKELPTISIQPERIQ